MTRQEAKNELYPIKEIEKDIKAIELEIERLMTVATKMTPSYGNKTTAAQKNKIEEAIVKIEEYRARLSRKVIEKMDYKNRCIEKVEKIEPKSLQKVLIYYYFMDYTMEKTAEAIQRSYQWTYSMYQSALDEYCKISDT